MNRTSLKSHLVTKFSLVLAALLVIMNVGFIILAIMVTPDTNGVDERAAPVIADAVTEVNGALQVRDTERMREIAADYPSLWFVALHEDDRRLVSGIVPPLYRSVAEGLSDIHHMDLRGDDGSVLTARITEISTTIGPVRLLYGGNAVPGNALLKMLWDTKIIYIPFTVIPVIGVFLCLPFLVGQALSGLKRTIATAASIDATRLGVRLSKDNVVDELHPLVTAINSALSRIDDDFSKRKRFFANAAHELRTPIAILQTRLEGLVPGPERERLLQDVSRLAAMAEQLLDMQRLGSSHEWKVVDLVSISEQVAAGCGPIAIAAGYDLEFHTEVSSFRIKGDEASLERAITNLVRNAIEHGGGAGTISVEVLRDGTVEVADEGPGIAKSQQDKVFEPFYRAKPKSTGAGLGLSIVDEIMRAHNGRVSIIEQVRGARFRLTLGRNVD